jgi:CARDB
MDRWVTYRGVCAAVAVFAGMAMTLAPAAIAGQKHKPKPDLELARSKILGKPYALTGARAEIRVSTVVKNSGRAEAGPTKNSLTLRHSGAPKFKGVTAKVPKLAKGEAKHSSGTAKLNIPSDAAPGGYQALLCADAGDDVAEQNEANNCDDVGSFYVVKKDWKGSYGGSTTPYQLDGVTETWHTSDARFELDTGSTVPSEGWFIYKLTQATVSYNDSGSAQGCTWSGSGVDYGQTAELRLTYDRDWYVGQGASGADFTYPVTPMCPPPGGTGYDGPAPEGLTPFYTGGTNDLPFGTTTLAGTAGPGGGYSWNWSLR